MKAKRSVVALALIATMMLVACSVDQVLADINVLIQTAATIGSAVGTVSPGDAAIVAKLANIASLGLTQIQAVYDAYKASGATTDLQKLQAAIAALKNDLPAELKAAQISDPATVLIVTNWVNLVTTTLDAIIAALPQLSPSFSASSKGAKSKVNLSAVPSPASIKARWANEVCANPKAAGNCPAMVN